MHATGPFLVPRPCVTFRSKMNFNGEQLLSLAQSPSWRTTPCRLLRTVYLTYLQISSISGGRLLHP